MQVNVRNLVSLSEANQNFSKVARMVESGGSAVVLKNNAPKFIILDYAQFVEMQMSESEKLDSIALRLMDENAEALEELAK